MVLGHGFRAEWMEMLSHDLVSHLGAFEALGEKGLGLLDSAGLLS